MLNLNIFEMIDYKENLDRLIACFDTTVGKFEVELFAKECPITVWNFVNLAEGRQKSVRKGNYYDGLKFHRVIKNFMIQGGCPDGTGTGTPGYHFTNECRPELRHDVKGTFSMANAGPDTNGSQFFITLVPLLHLDGRHTVFGRVCKGMDVIDRMTEIPMGMYDRPEKDIIINKLTINR
ncbi:MAG: peptidylprolyl isomerase [Oligoflexia bacterium]|nr:peptidylprolyl isomerase [Oligoflexia bacterium]